MIQKVVKLTDVKKNPNIIIGECVSMVKYGQVVAYVVTPERMEELLYAEEQFENAHLNGIADQRADQKRISVKLEDL